MDSGRNRLVRLARARQRLKDLDLEDACPTSIITWLQHTRTRDDHWKDKGTEPYPRFPIQLPYMPFLFGLMASERRLWIPKSREMMLSWAAVAYAVHLCQWTPNTQAIIQSERATKSDDLVVGRGIPGYARVLWENQDPFLKRLHPLTKDIEDMPADLLTWKNNSSLRGVPSGANQVRQYHPALFVMDEAAFLTEAEGSYNTAEPVTTQIIVISSAGPSCWFADRCQSILDKAGA